MPSNSPKVQQCCLPTKEDKNGEPSFVDMDFDLMPYPLSPTDGELQERANLTKRFGNEWSTPSYFFRPIDDGSLCSEMDNDDDLSISSNEVISTDIFSHTVGLQQQRTNYGDDNGISFINMIGLEVEDLLDHDCNKENNKEPSQGDDLLNCSISVMEW